MSHVFFLRRPVTQMFILLKDNLVINLPGEQAAHEYSFGQKNLLIL